MAKNFSGRTHPIFDGSENNIFEYIGHQITTRIQTL